MIFKGAVHTTLQIITVKYSACCSVTFKFVSSLLFLAFIGKNLEYFLSQLIKIQPLLMCGEPLWLSGNMWLLGLRTALLIHSGSLATCGSSASLLLLHLSTEALWQHVAPRPPTRSTYPLRLSGHMWLLSLCAAAPLIHSSTLTTCGSSVSKPLYNLLRLSGHMQLLGLQTTLLIHSGSLATCGSLASVLLLHLSTQAL